MDAWRDLVKKIDRSDKTVTDWEAGFLESLLRSRKPPTPRQLAVLTRLVEKYLGAELAAELHGQQRLF